MLYITHDLSLAQKIADKVYVMRKGKIIEHGPVENVLCHPKEQYMKQLLCAANYCKVANFISDGEKQGANKTCFVR